MSDEPAARRHDFSEAAEENNDEGENRMAYRSSRVFAVMVPKLRVPSLKWLRATTLIVASAILCCGAALLAAKVHGNREAPNSQVAVAVSGSVYAQPQPSAVPALPGGDKLEGVLITIRPSGFDPRSISRTAERFTLMVDNRSGLDAVTLRLDREGGSRLHDVFVPRQQLDWVQGVDLSPGEYLLSEASHPDWICRITIRPN